jgi:hypothetical protein
MRSDALHLRWILFQGSNQQDDRMLRPIPGRNQHEVKSQWKKFMNGLIPLDSQCSMSWYK